MRAIVLPTLAFFLGAIASGLFFKLNSGISAVDISAPPPVCQNPPLSSAPQLSKNTVEIHSTIQKKQATVGSCIDLLRQSVEGEFDDDASLVLSADGSLTVMKRQANARPAEKPPLNSQDKSSLDTLRNWNDELIGALFPEKMRKRYLAKPRKATPRLMRSLEDDYEDLANFVAKDQSEEWAVHMQENLRYFVNAISVAAHDIETHGIHCRGDACLMTGTTKSGTALENFKRELATKSEPWMKDLVHASSSSVSTPTDHMFKFFMRRAKK